MSDEENLKEMTEKEYAFPVSFPANDKMCVCPGMTLRDWFAGQALGALITNGGPHYHDTQEEVDQCRFELAQRAYGFADAMLEARKE